MKINIFVILLASVLVVFFVGQYFFPQEEVVNVEEENSDLTIEIMEEGEGKTVQEGDTAYVYYKGTFLNGSVFDSNIGGNPFSFTLGEGRVIEGWEKGVEGMKEGEKRRLVIAPHLAYGERGMGIIPPDSTLVFEIELLEIEKR